MLNFSAACTIELDDKVIVTGGAINWARVDVYNIDGWVMELPSLIQGRRNSGCGHYVNSDDKMVNYRVFFNKTKLVNRCD